MTNIISSLLKGPSSGSQNINTNSPQDSGKAYLEDSVLYSGIFHKSVWTSVILSMFTQVGGLISFPAYNLILSFWGAYASHTQDRIAIAAFLAFASFSVIVDIVFCSIWSKEFDAMYNVAFPTVASSLDSTSAMSTTRFCMAMFVFNLLTKVVALYSGAMTLKLVHGEWMYNVIHTVKGQHLKSQGGN